MFRIGRLAVRRAPFAVVRPVAGLRRLHASRLVGPSVLVSDQLDDVAIDLLRSRKLDVTNKPGLSAAELLEEIPHHDALIVRSGTQVTREVFDAGKKLKFVGRAGTGVDNIDLNAATQKGVIVMNTPGGNTNAAAELAFAMIMSVVRNIPQGNDSLRAGRWDRKLYSGFELKGKTVGVIGTGRIGQSVAQWCQAFGMKVIGYDAVMTKRAMADCGIESVTLEDIWKQSDIITFHTPLTDDTRNLIRDDTLAKCKDGVFIVNCARGGIIDEPALLRALENGKVQGAALDVFSTEPPSGAAMQLVNHPRVVSTPHLGASTSEAQTNVARDIAKFVADGLEGIGMKGVVNAPAPEFLANPQLKPFAQLAERLGRLQAQLVSGRVNRLHVSTTGDMLGEAHELIMSSMLMGFLGQRMDGVNIVNASYIAKRRGIEMVFSSATDEDARTGVKHPNSVKIECEFDDSSAVGRKSVVSGTVDASGVPRFLQLDEFQLQLEMPFTEHVLLCKINDQPGSMACITAAIAESGVNIGSVSLGRGSRGLNSVPVALAVVTVDERLDDSVLYNIRDMDLVRFAAVASLQNPTPVRKDLEGRPSERPKCPNFGSGPTKKRPGYVVGGLRSAPLGRSHRADIGKQRLSRAIEDSKRILGVPEDYHVGIVPASDTGAFEMAMWGMLGPRPVDVCYWESFGKGWAKDCEVLGLEHTKFEADYGKLPDLAATNPQHDILFTWNGTTSGVRVPNAHWIANDREGLTFCDATSAVFAQSLDWKKLDVTTYSWQKALGGEGGHGTIILSPRAVERLETFTPERPLPKIFRMTKDGKLMKDLFTGNVINTPSMLCVEDYLDALRWVERVGGTEELQRRSNANLAVLEEFVYGHKGFEFLAEDAPTRSNTSVCLKVDLAPAQLKAFKSVLERENVAYDIGSYRDAPPGLRIWCGPTIETSDVRSLADWFAWAYDHVQ